MKIGELLLEAQLVDADQIEAALANPDGLRLGSALIAARAVEPDAVARALAQQLGVPPAKSADLIAADPAARAMVPDALQRRLWALPYKLHGQGSVRLLEVAMRDPEDQAAINELGLAAGMKIDARVAPELLLREALHPRTELPPSVGSGGGGGSGGDGGLELDLADVGPRAAGSHGRRGAAYLRPTHPPAAAGAASADPASVLPPLQYDHTAPGKAVGSAFKILFILAGIAALVFIGLRFKKCITSTTKAVGAHYDSKLLGLSIDFPPDNGWRVAPLQKVNLGASKSEFFYRGGIPEAPVVTIVLARGPAEDVGTAAERAVVDLVKNAGTVGCEPSEDRPGAMVCKGYGSLTLFGRKRSNVTVDVHGWILSTGELAMAVVINSRITRWPRPSTS